MMFFVLLSFLRNDNNDNLCFPDFCSSLGVTWGLMIYDVLRWNEPSPINCANTWRLSQSSPKAPSSTASVDNQQSFWLFKNVNTLQLVGQVCSPNQCTQNYFHCLLSKNALYYSFCTFYLPIFSLTVHWAPLLLLDNLVWFTFLTYLYLFGFIMPLHRWQPWCMCIRPFIHLEVISLPLAQMLTCTHEWTDLILALFLDTRTNSCKTNLLVCNVWMRIRTIWKEIRF